MRLVLLLIALATCTTRERAPSNTLGQSTAAGPSHPIYVPIDAGNEVLARAISPGAIGNGAGGATPAPAAVPGDAQPNVESPPPAPEP